MRAAVLHATRGPLVLETRPDPIAGPGEARVRVHACGIGRTLVWNREGRAKSGRMPRVIGHEIAGVVDAVGHGVSSPQIGDRVVATYVLTCGKCVDCLAGRENVCQRRRGVVGRDIDGGLAELVALPAVNLVRVPNGVDDVGAAIAADAIATCLHVLRTRARLGAGETAVIVGAAGGVGIHAVQLAAHLGARVVAVDLGPDRLDLAIANGAHAAVDPSVVPLADAIRRATDGRGADVVMDMVGRSEILSELVAALSPTGRLVLVGSSDRAAAIEVRHDTLRGDTAILASQYATRVEVAEALDLVASGAVRPVVTRRGPLDAAGALLDDVAAGRVLGRACIVLDDPAA
jgi:alcohol dehydrogenase, propanol-preferring